MGDEVLPLSLSGVSRTALSAAAARARHLIVDSDPKIFRDELALPLCGLGESDVLDTEKLGLPPSSAIWVLRARYAEDRLEAARLRGIRQYVILGAGLDSFALRNASTLDSLVVFEVDDPSMQAWKRARLASLGLEPPTQLRFTPCDFEKSSLDDALGASNFDRHAPAFVSWLGVTQYLVHDAISSTLRWVAGLATGSEIVLTFAPGSPELKQSFRERGIRFETFFTPDEISKLLLDAGLTNVDLLDLDHAERIYFGGRSDSLHAPTDERLISARSP